MTRKQDRIRSGHSPLRPQLEALERRDLLNAAQPSALVVKLHPQADAALPALVREAQALQADWQATRVPNLYRVSGDPDRLAVLQTVFSNNDLVVHVGWEQTYRIARVPNDPRYTDGSLWGLSGTFGIGAAAAWDVRIGSTAVTVADIDTGVDINHPDLFLNIWINQAEIPPARRANLIDIDGDGLITFRDLNSPFNQGVGKIIDSDNDGRISGRDLLAPYNADGTGGWADGISNDGDPYIDDLVGWDFVNNDNNPGDDHGHGTHVGGTILATGNNGIGVVGVNWRGQLMALKFLAADGQGSDVHAAEAVRYAVDHGARVSNNSWGDNDADSIPLRDAIEYARQRGHVFVAAAGNGGRNIDTGPPFYPAGFPHANIVSVAAINSSGALASFSNYGTTSVDIGAPGVSILSTTRGTGYGLASGTSMACPHVAGVVALIWAQHPTWTSEQVISHLLNTGTTTTSLVGRTVTGKRVSAATALTSNRPPVVAPIADQILPAGQTSLTVNLSATDPDGDPVTFTARSVDQAYFLDTRFGLYFTGSYSQNYGGRNEKWVRGDFPAAGTWYFITPVGEFYRWDGRANSATGTLIAVMEPRYWENPALLHDALPGTAPVSFTIQGNQLTATQNPGFSGGFGVVVTGSDGAARHSQEFLVRLPERPNQPPTLEAISDRTLPSGGNSITVPLTASDPDNDPLTFSAQSVDPAYFIDQRLGLYYVGTYSQNYGGRNEKWMRGGPIAGTWYFIVPDGRLYRWDGRVHSATGTLIVSLTPDHWADPTRVHDAPAGTAPVTFTFQGAELTATQNAGYSGAFGVIVNVTDGRAAAQQSFLVDLPPRANQPPVLQEIPDQTFPASQQVMTVTLSATDPDGDPLTYSFTPIGLNYFLDQRLGLNFVGTYSQNYGGRNEKWVRGAFPAAGTWYFITPDGGLYRWDGRPETASGPLVANLSPAVWENPALLHDATPSTAPVSFTLNGDQLTMTVEAGFTEGFGVEVRVSDGTVLVTRRFMVNRTPP